MISGSTAYLGLGIVNRAIRPVVTIADRVPFHLVAGAFDFPFLDVSTLRSLVLKSVSEFVPKVKEGDGRYRLEFPEAREVPGFCLYRDLYQDLSALHGEYVEERRRIEQGLPLTTR
jgi:hypothetical protein